MGLNLGTEKTKAEFFSSHQGKIVDFWSMMFITGAKIVIMRSAKRIVAIIQQVQDIGPEFALKNVYCVFTHSL